MTTAPGSRASDVWTVGQVIESTTAYLRKHGSDTPRLDAEILLATVRRTPRIQLYVDYHVSLSVQERTEMRSLVRRRAQAEPVAYLVGHREFYGLDFQVTRDVLIPRPETETLVVELVTAARRVEAPRVLDVGTGSGCIAIAAAMQLPTATVTATDISIRALEVARSNVAAHRLAERIRLVEGDLFAPLPPGEEFDFIVSNPPYVANAEFESLPADVRLHEPRLALAGGAQGLEVIQPLIAQAAGRLAPGGQLFVEISPEQAPAVAGLCVDHSMHGPPRVVNDSAGRPRVVHASRGG